MEAAVKKVQDAGRFGDGILVHMNPIEVQALANMSPTGELTTNPKTGQPEAFLPLLGAFLGSTFATELGLAALMGGSALGGSMLGAGLGAFGGSMLQGDPWQQALAGGALAAGTTGLFGGILGSGDDLISKTAADAVAAPTLGPTQNIGAFAGPGSGFYQEGVGVGSDGFSNFLVDSSGVAIAPNFSAPVNVANAFSPQALSEGALDASKSFYPLPIGPLQGAVPTVVSPDAMAVGRAAVDKAGFGDRLRAGIGAYDFASPEALASYGLVGAGWAGDGMNALTGTPTAVIPDFTKDKVNIPEQFPVLRASLTPPSGYRPGIDPEFRFFNPINRLAAQGGLVLSLIHI